MRTDSATDGLFSNSHVVTPYSASVRGSPASMSRSVIGASAARACGENGSATVSAQHASIA